MHSLIRFFTHRHLLVNLITILVLIGGVVAWNTTNKEELPDVTFNTVRISTSYSGASAQDVEFYLTKPMEEAIQGIDGIYRISSTSSAGNSSISVELNPKVKDIDKIVTEIQSQISSVQLPEDVLKLPRVRLFETSKKAVIDVAIYNEDLPLLDTKSRSELQELARGLETNLLAQKEIFEIQKKGYLIEEITIKALPEKYKFFKIPLTTIGQEIQRNHIRSPAGTLKSGRNEQVTVLSELDSKAKLDNLVVQGTFDSPPVKLSAITSISDGFEPATSIFKVNGREAILFSVIKNSRYGILEALDAVKTVVTTYESTILSNTPITLALLDDESVDVRNRLSIIAYNGALGFVLIVITLLIFLNKRSGFWVAMGIPFTLAFTLIAGHFLGFTINGITLAGIIIVLGIVVDDAIIVAENISRKLNAGEPLHTATVDGTREVVGPILASVLTTCAAFVPLYFFSGRYGMFIKFIPPMIFLMLLASVLESFFLLPSHMALFPKNHAKKVHREKKWVIQFENAYERLLKKLLPKRYIILAICIIALIGTGILVTQKFQFVMFPDEESREITISGRAHQATSPLKTAETIQPIEEFLRQYIGTEAVGVITDIARGRRGDASVENQFRITLELIPIDARKKSTDTLVAEIEAFITPLKNIDKIKISKARFGQSSGSVFEVLVKENDDAKRELLTEKVVQALNDHPNVINAEVDIIPTKKEYILTYDQAHLKRLSVNPATLSQTLRTILNGRQLYTLFRNDEEIEVTLTVTDDYRTTMDAVLSLPIENTQSYLIPLKNVITATPINAKNTIRRQDQKRSGFVYADIKDKSPQSPLEIADEFETAIFPKLLIRFPSSQLEFAGEVIDTRESKRNLTISIVAVIGLIYIILAVLFNSVLKPLRIMLVIPFGLIGVVIMFYLHQKTVFGFYASIGTLGMLGVVVNDAIVMLDKLDKTVDDGTDILTKTASIAKTRLRAIVLTTLTTVAGVMPTAYGIGGTDTMLSDMMIALSWGLLFGTLITLIIIPCFYLFEKDFQRWISSKWSVSKTSLSILITAIALTSPLYATPTTLSLEDFTAQAMQKDTVFHTLLMDQLTFAYQKDLTVSAKELALSVTSQLQLNSPSQWTDNQLTLTHTLPSLGQTLSVSYDRNEITNTHTSSFGFSQDIARNAFGKSITLDTRIHTLKIDIATHQLIEAYEDYLAQLITLYYTWIRQYESLTLANSSYKESEKALQSMINRQKQKIADQTDVNKLKLQMLAKQEQIIRYDRDYTDTTHRIQRALQLPTSTPIRPTTFTLDPLPESVEPAITQFKQESRTARILSKLKDQVHTQLDRTAQDLLPSIQVGASLTHTTTTTTQVGASFDLPILNKKAKAQHELSKIDVRQTTLDTQTTLEKLLTDLRNLHLALTTQKKLIQVATQKRILTQEILKEESENYAYGKITLNDYIDAINRHDTSRFDEIDRQITYQQLNTEWKRLSDQLILTLPNEPPIGEKVRIL